MVGGEGAGITGWVEYEWVRVGYEWVRVRVLHRVRVRFRVRVRARVRDRLWVM